MQRTSNTTADASFDIASYDVLIVGGGQAGGRTAQCLREQGFQGSVALLGAEDVLPYERPSLSKAYLMGQAEEADLMLHPTGFWAAQRIDLFLGCSVTHLDRTSSLVSLSDGRSIRYGKLIVATGGLPRRLNVSGNGVDDVLTLRTLDDAKRLRSALKPGTRLLVIGAGVIGMELASSAHMMGVDVQVLEAGSLVMGRILCPDSSAWLTDLHRKAGVMLRMRVQLERIERSEQDFTVIVKLESGAIQTFSADVVVCAIGVNVAQSFLTDAGLGDDDGMEVNELCRSPHDAHCYAVGDVARTPSPYYGNAQRQETWRNAENQAKAVAATIMGSSAPYVEIPWMWTDQHGRNIQVVGTPQPGMTTVIRGEPGSAPFSIFWLKEGRLCGGVLVDSGRDRRVLEQLVRSQRSVQAELLSRPDLQLKSL